MGLLYVSLPNGLSCYPQADVNGRNTGKELKNAAGELRLGEYLYYRKVGDHATNMPSAVYFGNTRENKYEIKDNIKYKYDSMGNISEIRENGALTVRYFYDTLNRLIREDNKKLGRTWLYSYDHNGNILTKREFDFALRDTEKLEELTESKVTEYSYEGDKLLSLTITDESGTSVESFEYDEIGNPTKYRNSTNAGWERGRLMNLLSGNSFRYDGTGRRIKRNTTVFSYDSQGNLIKSSDGLEFAYDTSGISSVKYNNSTYFYRKDAQGNIIALLDNAGKVVVQYIYDAWGNHAVIDTSGKNLGTLNPFRYRGYFYDDCTGLYYLKTRYYDPEIGRFITIDGISYLDPETINGLNLYAYCGNNPVMAIDPEGNMPKWLKWVLGGLAVAGLSLAIVLTCGVAGAGAAVVGAAMLTGGLVSAGINALDQVHDGGKFDWAELAISTLSGIAYGLVVGLSAGGAAGAWSWGAYAGKLAVAAVTSLLNSWNEGKNLKDTLLSLGSSLLISSFIQGVGYGVGKFGGQIVGKLIEKIFPKNPNYWLTMGDIGSYLWSIPAVKTGIIRFFSGVWGSIWNDFGR